MKIFKRGEWLFKEGDKISHLLLLQSGSVNLCLIRNKKNIEIHTLGANHLLGESVIFNQPQHLFSAYCVQETKVIEVPVETLRSAIEGASQPIKIVLKSSLDRLRMAQNEIRNLKLEKDSSPMPEDQVARAFGALFHSVRTRAVQGKDSIWEADWVSLKQYAQRVFGESPKRLEQTVTLLVKLKQAELIFGKPPENPDGPDELQTVRFMQPQYIEDFFEFYQYYYFKGGKTELLKSDDFCSQMLDIFIRSVSGQTPDRFGVVSIEFATLAERFKEAGINMNNDHFSRLELKGVYSKRTQIAGAVYVQFELKEYLKVQNNWKILKEIEKWNEKGFVDKDEKEPPKVAKLKGEACPACSAPLQSAQKFCGECGHKLQAA